MKNFSKIILVPILLVSACSKEQANISVTIPAKPANLIGGVSSNASVSFSGMSSAGSSSTDLPAPASLAEVNCIAVNVMAADIPRAIWDKDSSSSVTPQMKFEHAMKGEPCAYGGVTSMVVPYSGSSSTVTLNVPVGSNRLFQLLGFKAPPGSCQSQLDAGQFFSQFGGKIEPTELGRTITSINGSTTVNLNGKYDSSRNMHMCSVDGGNNGPYWYTDPSTRVYAGAQIRTAAYGGVGFVRKYFLYQDANRSGSLSVTMWDSSANPTYSNITSNLITGAYTGYDISVDSSGNPWVVIPGASMATLYKYSGGSWTQVGATLSMSSTQVCRLAGEEI